jgi:hypothetical protein
MNVKKRYGLLGVALLLFVLAVTAAHAQEDTATLSGQIQDSSGAVIRDAKITIRNVDTGISRSVVSGDKGEYIIHALYPGEYALTVEAAGFETKTSSGIILTVAQEANLNVQLPVGSSDQKVEVVAGAMMTDTETSSLLTSIGLQKIEDLPLLDRDFTSLVLVVPGAYQPGQNSTLNAHGGLSINGASEASNNYIMNGINDNDQASNIPSFLPPLDQIQEFSVFTGTYPAQYGRNSGGQIVLVTKSGTNSYHGSLFEYVRNQITDAKGYFTPVGQTAIYKRNDYGGTLGGPIIHDRTMFFFVFETFADRNQATGLATVPTPAMRKGDFSSLLTGATTYKVINPFTGLAFTTPNVIDPGLIDPLGHAIVNYYPQETTTTPLGFKPSNNYSLNEVTAENRYQSSLRIDHQIGKKDSSYANYNWLHDSAFEPIGIACGSSHLPGFACTPTNSSQLVALGETHIFTPNLLNELRVGYNRYRLITVPQDANAVFPTLPGAFPAGYPNNGGLPYTKVSSLSTIGHPTTLPQDRADNTYEFVDDLTWAKGNHTFKVGTDLTLFRGNVYFVQDGTGALDFLASSGTTTSGYSLADVLLGLPTTTNSNPIAPKFHQIYSAYDAFVQDDWRIKSNLTLNIGVRWELDTPLADSTGQLSSFDPTVAGGGYRVVNQDGVDNHLWQTDLNNFAPRFGFAWMPYHGQATVVHGGVGIFYNSPTVANGSNTTPSGPIEMSMQYPFRNPQTFTTSKALVLTLANPFPSGAGASAQTPTGINPNFRTAYLATWSLGLEQQFASATVLKMNYVGSKGTKLPTEININQPEPGPGTLAQVNARRPFPNFGNVSWLNSSGNSEYEGLQISITQNAKRGLSFLASFAWGKSIDGSPGYASPGNSSNVLPQNSYNLTSERGLSDFNVAERFIFTPTYQLPFGKGMPYLRHGVGNALLGDWKISSITTLQTGRPFTLYYSGNQSNTYNYSDRPNVIGNPNAGPKTPAEWFNVAAFAQPPCTSALCSTDSDSFGNESRNTIIGPSTVNVDAALRRSIAFHSRYRFDMIFQAFNIFNHPHFSNPESNFDSSSVGTITSASNARQMQLGLKLLF